MAPGVMKDAATQAFSGLSGGAYQFMVKPPVYYVEVTQGMCKTTPGCGPITQSRSVSWVQKKLDGPITQPKQRALQAILHIATTTNQIDFGSTLILRMEETATEPVPPATSVCAAVKLWALLGSAQCGRQ
jgi:hypothetical protein